VHEGLANIEAVGVAGERVQSEDNVHVVLLNRVLGNFREIMLSSVLLAVVKLGTQDLDSCGVGNTDAQRTNTSELVDCGRVKKQSIAFFEKGPAFVA
jgi:hypothetical protein